MNPSQEGREEFRRSDAVLSRRRALRLGVAATAGAATIGWTRPSISTIRVSQATVGTPPPHGNPSVDVFKTVSTASRVGTTVTTSGSFTINNVGDVVAVIATVTMVLEFRIKGGPWQQAATSFSLTGCGPGTSIPLAGSCTASYSETATDADIPDATGFRNVLTVTLVGRDTDFLDRAEFEV